MMKPKKVFTRFQINHQNLIIASILLFSLYLRVLGLSKSIWLDEWLSINIISGDDYAQNLLTNDHPPLYFVLLRLWSALGTEEWFLRLPSIIFGVGTVITVIYWMKMYSGPAGIIAGVLCSTLPMMLRYSQEIRHYPLLLFATSLGFYFSYKTVLEPQRKSSYILLAISLVVVVNTHLIGIFILFAIAIYQWLSLTPMKSFFSTKYFASFSLPILCYLPIFILLSPKDPATWWMPPVTTDLVISTFTNVSGYSTVRDWLDQISSNNMIFKELLKIFFTVTITIPIISILTCSNWKRVFPLLSTSIFYLLEVVGVSLVVLPIFWYRTLLPVLIPIIGLVALGLSTISRKAWRVLGISCLMVFPVTFSVRWIGHNAKLPYESWREISDELESELDEGDILIYYPPYASGPISFYLPELVRENWIEVPLGSDAAAISKLLSGKYPDEAGDLQIFLVTRFDGNVQKYVEPLVYIEEYLRLKGDCQIRTTELGILSLKMYGTCPQDETLRRGPAG